MFLSNSDKNNSRSKQLHLKLHFLTLSCLLPRPSLNLTRKNQVTNTPFLLAPLIKKHHWIIVFILFRWSISDTNQAWRIVMEREESLHGLCWCSINRERCGWSYPSREEDQQHPCWFDLHFFSHPCSDDCYACHDSTSLQEGWLRKTHFKWALLPFCSWSWLCWCFFIGSNHLTRWEWKGADLESCFQRRN